MLQEQKKVAKIIAELTTYFLILGADQISSSVVKQGRQGIITFRANYEPGCEGELRDMERYLTEPKNNGIEDIYWELAGVGDSFDTNELLLVGMMVDRAEVNVEDGFVNLKLYKEFTA